MEKSLNKQDSSILNSKQKNFLFKCVVMLCIIVLYIAHLMPQYENSYAATLVDKVDRLCSIDGPKIVLIGNSNVAFGFNSELIEQEMGMPVVNMGLHGGLGNLFHDNMIGYNVHEGDIYVVSHCTYWNEGKIENYIAAWATVENHKELWKLIPKNEYISMVKSFPAYVKKMSANHSSMKDIGAGEGYTRDIINEYGDVAVQREHKASSEGRDIWAPITSAAEFDVLNEWNRYLEERGAKMVVSSFPVYYDNWPSDDAYMDTYQQDLVDGLDCDVISYWKDYAYPKEYFYDTEYHLTNEGAEVRTKQLIEDLKAWQNAQK